MHQLIDEQCKWWNTNPADHVFCRHRPWKSIFPAKIVFSFCSLNTVQRTASILRSGSPSETVEQLYDRRCSNTNHQARQALETSRTAGNLCSHCTRVYVQTLCEGDKMWLVAPCLLPGVGMVWTVIRLIDMIERFASGWGFSIGARVV